MKAIMISIQPQWVELILNLIKKDEIRKGAAIGKAINKLIKEQGVAPMLIYCTKEKWKTKPLLAGDIVIKPNADPLNKHNIRLLNGKVVARFNATADLLELKMIEGGLYFTTPDRDWFSPIDFNENAQIDNFELLKYTGYELGTLISDIHINNLEIFDKPKEISEFKHWVFYKECSKCPYGKCENDYGLCSQCCEIKPLTKAPQSWCYVEVE